MTDRQVPAQQGDEQELFERYANRLQRVTRVTITASPEIIDDACAFAWMTLVATQPRREAIFSWLCTVARHEALRLTRLWRQELSRELNADDDFSVGDPLAAKRGRQEDAESLLDIRERLEGLSPRLREVVFLHAAGWRYRDLAERLGVSEARVDQLLATARLRMREMDLREIDATSVRGRRLREIEDDPPPYIAASIGRQPWVTRKHGHEETRREWKRLVLEIEDYRNANGITDPVLPLGTGHDDVRRETLQHRIADYRQGRGLSIGVEQ